MAAAFVLLPATALAQDDAVSLDEEEDSGQVELDEEAPPAPTRTAPVRKSEAAVVATAGQMSEGAAAAKRLFDGKKMERSGRQPCMAWWSASPTTTRATSNLRSITWRSPYNRLKFYQASYAIFGAIAANDSHIKFKETLLWLAKLATQLPEPADIIERVGKYSDRQVARFKNSEQRDLYWQLNYMLGRYKYRNREYKERNCLVPEGRQEQLVLRKIPLFYGH